MRGSARRERRQFWRGNANIGIETDRLKSRRRRMAENKNGDGSGSRLGDGAGMNDAAETVPMLRRLGRRIRRRILRLTALTKESRRAASSCVRHAGEQNVQREQQRNGCGDSRPLERSLCCHDRRQRRIPRVAKKLWRTRASVKRRSRRILSRQLVHGILSRSASHALADESLGARQSPRGESEPPELTFGPFGIALRLN